jgi:hypothetical protein
VAPLTLRERPALPGARAARERLGYQSERTFDHRTITRRLPRGGRGWSKMQVRCVITSRHQRAATGRTEPGSPISSACWRGPGVMSPRDSLDCSRADRDTTEGRYDMLQAVTSDDGYAAVKFPPLPVAWSAPVPVTLHLAAGPVLPPHFWALCFRVGPSASIVRRGGPSCP